MSGELYRLIDTVSGDGKFSSGIIFDPAHPLFSGHFPDAPVVPGAVLVQVVRELAEQITGKCLNISELVFVKFLVPVAPERTTGLLLEGTYELNDKGHLNISAQFIFEGTLAMKFRGTYSEITVQ